MRNLAFLILTILFLPLSPSVGKESPNQLCNIRGYEIIFPYEKAINELNWEPEISFNEGLEKTISWFQDNFF